MRKTRLAVFASGSGSNYEAIAKACSEGLIDAEVVLLVCDKPGAYVLERAKRYGTECFAFNPKEYGSREAYEAIRSWDDVRPAPLEKNLEKARQNGEVLPKI